MKKILVLILSLVLTLCFAVGCTETTAGGSSSGGSSSGGTAGTPTTGGSSTSEIPEGSYVVTLQFPTGTAILPTLTGIYAVWSNDSGVYTAEFNSSGVAYREDLDGEYTVTLSETPDGYTYNPNIYEADGTTSGREVSVYMYALSDFEGGSGVSLAQGMRATVSVNSANPIKVYRITFNSDNIGFYFDFTPSENAEYVVETYASVYDDEINPTIYRYSYGQTIMSTTTGGGESGTYTRNARYVLDLAETNLGNSYYFCISIESATNEFPKYLDVAISIEGNYSNSDLYEDYEMVAVPDDIAEEGTSWSTPSGSYTYLKENSLMGGDFVTSKVCSDGKTRTCIAYNSADGFYYYNANPTQESDSAIDFTDGNWTLLFVKITNTYMYGGVLGVLQIADNGWQCWYKTTANNKKLNYYDMLTAYQEAANKDSAYPVTEQLKECLQNISITRQYFYDNNGLLDKPTSDGGDYGYTAYDENQWLYGCGVYV